MKKLVKKTTNKTVEVYGRCSTANCKKACKNSGRTAIAAAVLASSVRASAGAY